MCIHVPSSTALPGPAGGGPRATQGKPSRHAHVSADALGRSGGCGGGSGVGIVGDEGRADSTAEKGFAEVLMKNHQHPTETCERSVRESDIAWVFTRRSEKIIAIIAIIPIIAITLTVHFALK